MKIKKMPFKGLKGHFKAKAARAIEDIFRLLGFLCHLDVQLYLLAFLRGSVNRIRSSKKAI